VRPFSTSCRFLRRDFAKSFSMRPEDKKKAENRAVFSLFSSVVLVFLQKIASAVSFQIFNHFPYILRMRPSQIKSASFESTMTRFRIPTRRSAFYRRR
jgi:hypothetical protein